ncbi:MAG: methyltransferase domain-containing protein [Pirellulales bacterium]|nr:methyltransferase domain-containing protein [Pirellulales bacterium]
MNDPRIAFFDRLSAEWDHSEQDAEKTISRLEQLGDLLRLRQGLDLLEVGCGTGQLTAWLAERVAPGRVTAMDFSDGMLGQARAKQIDADFRLGDVCVDPLPAASADLALCFHSFPHFRDQQAALRNLARALRPAGRLVVIHLASSAAINAFHDSVGGEVAGDHLPDESCWNDLLSRNSLRRIAWVDREDMFFLEAERLRDTETNQTTF